MQGFSLDNDLNYSSSFLLVRAMKKNPFPFTAGETEAQLCICSPTHSIEEIMLSLMKQYVQRLPQQSLVPLNFLNEGAASF